MRDLNIVIAAFEALERKNPNAVVTVKDLIKTLKEAKEEIEARDDHEFMMSGVPEL
jgi:hypothetical protein